MGAEITTDVGCGSGCCCLRDHGVVDEESGDEATGREPAVVGRAETGDPLIEGLCTGELFVVEVKSDTLPPRLPTERGRGLPW